MGQVAAAMAQLSGLIICMLGKILQFLSRLQLVRLGQLPKRLANLRDQQRQAHRGILQAQHHIAQPHLDRMFLLDLEMTIKGA
jgi:hypothetical protein